MSNDQPSRKPAPKGGGAPMGSTISIVIAVIAVVVGFLILKNINDSDDGGSSSSNTTNPTANTEGSGDTSSTTSIVSTETTTAGTTPPQTVGATVIVANASGVPGAAGQMTKSLQTVNFTLIEATNSAGTETRLDVTKVYYVDTPEALAVANGVVQVFGGGAVVAAVMPTPPPVEGGDIKTATVLVMLGKDFGGKALPALAGAPTETTLVTTPIDNTTTTGA